MKSPTAFQFWSLELCRRHLCCKTPPDVISDVGLEIEWMRPSNQKDTVCRGRKGLVATSMFYNICGVNNKWLIFRASLKWSYNKLQLLYRAQVWGLPWKASRFHSKKPGYQLCQLCLLVVTTGCAVVTRCYSRRAWRKQNSPHLTAPSGIHVVRDL